MREPRQTRALSALILFLGVALAACSSGGASPSPSPQVSATGARTVKVTTLDTMRFEPSAFEVAVGETVVFEVTNVGKVVHEFYVGTAEEQVEHEDEMKAGHATHDHENSVSVDPGQTKALELKFARAGALEIGCHVPGHWMAGMRGTITVK